VTAEIRQLIRQMSGANPLWGAPRIHGELLKLGIDVGQTSVAKYRVRRRVPPSQGWRTYLRKHADGIAAMDLFVAPTTSFRPLYGMLIMGHGRRQLLWFGVTARPTAEWIVNQLAEACGWEQIPRYLIRDRDGAYGEIFIRRVRSIGCGALPRDRFRPYVLFNVKATRPRCDEGCPDRPGRASHKESESWSISKAFVALDTAKLRNAVAIADAGRNGEIRYLGEIDNTEAESWRGRSTAGPSH
jgi:hypothetical protein